MSDSHKPPGWYPHPTMAGTQRYWDGAKWTDNVAPLAAASQTAGSGVDIGKDRQTETLANIGMITSIFLPCVGFVIGAVLLPRRPGMGAMIMVVSVAVTAFIAAVLQLDTP